MCIEAKYLLDMVSSDSEVNDAFKGAVRNLENYVVENAKSVLFWS